MDDLPISTHALLLKGLAIVQGIQDDIEDMLDLQDRIDAGGEETDDAVRRRNRLLLHDLARRAGLEDLDRPDRDLQHALADVCAVHVASIKQQLLDDQDPN